MKIRSSKTASAQSSPPLMLDVDDNAARHVVANPGIANPGIANPGIANPGIANPGITNPGITNPGIANPGIGRRCKCLASTPYSPTASGSTGNSEWRIARI
jgi:PPE-repeat protein